MRKLITIGFLFIFSVSNSGTINPIFNMEEITEDIDDEPPEQPFCNPIQNKLTITSKYGYRKHPTENKIKLHNGIDIGAKKGTKVFNTRFGVIEIAKFSDSYGNYIVINHLNGYKTV